MAGQFGLRTFIDMIVLFLFFYLYVNKSKVKNKYVLFWNIS